MHLPTKRGAAAGRVQNGDAVVARLMPGSPAPGGEVVVQVDVFEGVWQLAGLAGGALAIVVAMIAGWVFKRRGKAREAEAREGARAEAAERLHQSARAAEAKAAEASKSKIEKRRAELADVVAIDDADKRSDALADLNNTRS